MPDKLYKVNRLYLSGKGKNKFFENAIVKGRQLENIEEKIKDGSIIPFDVAEEPAIGLGTEGTEGTNVPLFSFEKNGQTVNVFPDTDLDTPGLTKALISSELFRLSIQFDPSDKKADLFSILVDSLK